VKILGNGNHVACFAKKKGNGWMCTMDEKKWSLYKWVGKKRNNPYGIYNAKIVFNVKYLKQHQDV